MRTLKFFISIVALVFFMNQSLAQDDAVLRWDDGENYTAIGLVSGYTYYVSSYFTDEETGPYAGAIIEEVQVWIGDTDAQFTLKIHGEGTSTSPGPLLHEQAFTPDPESWNSIVLDEDVLIEGNDLWVGYKVAENSFGQFVPGADDGPAVAGYGDMFSMDGENYESLSNTYGLDFNWNIATVLLPDTSMAQQQYSLNNGYHFISSNLQLENPDMLQVLDEILTDNLDFVRNSDGEMVHKIGNQWMNNIGDWITTEGYLVKMTGEESLTLQGMQIDPSSPITCEAGFTFVSYLPDQEMDALEAFQSILNDDLIFIRNSAGEMVQKIGDQWVNNIGYCQPGEGYLVKSSNTQELIYLNK